jgi:ABC-2 type transport system ATP-binding protein
MEAITFKAIKKAFRVGSFKRKEALKGLSFSVKKGEVFGFLGPNGAGKSTAIKILLNFIYPDSGKVFINNKCVHTYSLRKEIGYLPENPYLYDNLSPEELLSFKGRVCGLRPLTIKERSEELLNGMNLLEVKKRPIRTFSKGMVQRLSLTLTLINNPNITILDEPFSGLDPLVRVEALELLLTLKEKGKTIFFSSHILNDIERICDRIAILNEGSLIYLGQSKDIISRYGNIEQGFLAIIKGNA